MRSVFHLALFALFFTIAVGLAGPIVSKPGLTGKGSFEGDFDYAATDAYNATLTIKLINTSSAAKNFLTAFAFNNPHDRISDVSLISTNSHFKLLGGKSYDDKIKASPFGRFDIGAGITKRWNGGRKPWRGIGVGEYDTFVFTFTGTDLDTLTEEDFFASLSSPPGAKEGTEAFVARFHKRGGDKVPGELRTKEVPPIGSAANAPEPTSLLLASLGASIMFLNARRGRKRAVETSLS